MISCRAETGGKEGAPVVTLNAGGRTFFAVCNKAMPDLSGRRFNPAHFIHRR